MARKSDRRFQRALGMFLVVLLAVAVYPAYTIYHANFHVIVNGEAYRASQMNSTQLTRTFQHYGIKSILNLRGENAAKDWYRSENQTAAKFNVIHYDLSLSSGRELTAKQLADLVVLLRQAPKPILIHCLGGADRSGLAAALYRYAIKGQKADEADNELSVWYGHVPLIRPKVKAMDRSFWNYVSNKTARVNPPK